MSLNRPFWILVLAAFLAFPAVTLQGAEDSLNKMAGGL